MLPFHVVKYMHLNMCVYKYILATCSDKHQVMDIKQWYSLFPFLLCLVCVAGFFGKRFLSLLIIVFFLSYNLSEELGVTLSERMTLVGMKMCLEVTDSDFLTPL